MIKFFAAISIIALSWIATAWVLMLAIGIVRAEWIHQLPTIGFGVALIFSSIVLLRSLMSGALSGVIKAIFGGDNA